MSTYYVGARIFDRGQLVRNLALSVDKNHTQRILPETEIPENAPVVHLNGGILSGGFIDTQANGGGEVLVNDDFSADGLETVIQAHYQFGTVAMLPTFITDSQQKYHRAIAAIADGVKNGLNGLLGGHFEGPFIHPAKKGTHQARFIRQPDVRDFACYQKHADYLQHSILSLAPEQVRAGTIAQIKPAIPQIQLAHSMATHQEILAAWCEGLTGITHLYNAMRAFSGRDVGAIGSAAELGLHCGIIADGIHSHPYALAMAYRNLGAEKLMLVTDAMSPLGAENMQSFDLMGIKVFVQADRLINEDGALAGAQVTMLQCVQNAMKYMPIDCQSVLQMAVSTPAYYLGRPDLARIYPRPISEIIYLDEQLQTVTALPQLCGSM